MHTIYVHWQDCLLCWGIRVWRPCHGIELCCSGDGFASAMAGDTWGHNLKWGMDWRPVGGGLGCYSAPHSAQDGSQPQRIIRLKMSVSLWQRYPGTEEAEKCKLQILKSLLAGRYNWNGWGGRKLDSSGIQIHLGWELQLTRECPFWFAAVNENFVSCLLCSVRTAISI